MSFKAIGQNWKEIFFGVQQSDTRKMVVLRVSYTLIKVYLAFIVYMGFTCFIIEESMQTRGFGRYSLIQGKMWSEAATLCNESAELLSFEKGFLRVNQVVNPIFGWVYYRYAQAEEMKLWGEMKRIEKELAGLGNRMTVIEGKLEVKPIDITPTGNNPQTPVAQIDLTQNEIRPVKQVDYKTHAERVEQAIDAKVTGFVKTPSGKKYHRPGCRTVSGKQVQQLTKEQIDEMQLTPCMVCSPQLQKGN